MKEWVAAQKARNSGKMTMAGRQKLLEVKNLAIHFVVEHGTVDAVKNVSFTVKARAEVPSPSWARAAAAKV